MQRRYSKQRELILNCVKHSSAHPTPDMVYQMVAPACPNLSRGTVYRNLNLLAEDGALERLPFTVERFDARTEPHPHFICQSCGAVTDLELEHQDELDEEVRLKTGNIVQRHATYFYGICAECAQKQKEATGVQA